MRVALGQLEAGPEKAANLAAMEGLVERARAAGSRLAVFPEAAMVRAEPEADLAALAEPLDGPFLGRLRDVAAEAGVAVVAGMFESIPGARQVHNTVVAIGGDGALLAVYRKIHLYDAFGYRESARVRAGSGEVAVFDLDGLRFGIATCYDLRFPALAEELSVRGAEAILLPAAWMRGPLKEDHWEVLVRARAIENTVYVAAAAQTGPRFVGRSLVVDPMGVVVAGLGEVEGLLVADLDPARVGQVRATNPSLRNRRPDVYRAWREGSMAPSRVATGP
jgi:predicted amidohydrolase